MMEMRNCDGQPEIEWSEVARIGAEHQSGPHGSHLSQSLKRLACRSEKSVGSLRDCCLCPAAW